MLLSELLVVGTPALPSAGTARPWDPAVTTVPPNKAWGGRVSRARQASVMHCGNIAWVRPEHAMQLQCTAAARKDACVWPRRRPGHVRERAGAQSKAGLQRPGEVVQAAWSKRRALASRIRDSGNPAKVQVETYLPEGLKGTPTGPELLAWFAFWTAPRAG